MTAPSVKVTDLQVLQAYADQDEGFADEKLMNSTGQCEKVCYRAMERVERKGYIDYGVSLRSGWLTPKGQAALASAAGATGAAPAGGREC